MEITVKKKIEKPVLSGLSVPSQAKTIQVAWVEVTHGKTSIDLGLSRYSTETEWYLDCQFSNRIPVFNHGEGDRCCLKKMAQNELKDAIEAAEFTT